MSATTRISALEGLRGVAAMIVVMRHTLNATPMSITARRPLLEGVLAPLFNAQGAVQIFFILSGFVLARSMSRNRRPVDTLQFLTKRVFRIHPPYVAAVLAAWGASFFYVRDAGRPGVTPWLELLERASPDASQLALSLLFPGNAFGLLSVGWSLEIEMIYSLLLPLLFWISLRTHWSLLIALALAPIWMRDLPWQAVYALDFCLGIALFAERERVIAGLSRLPTWGCVALFVAAIVAFAGPQLLGWHQLRLGIFIADASWAAITLTSLGSLGLIALALRVGWWVRILETRSMLFVGRVSYSFYLLHLPITIVSSRFLPPEGGLPAWLWLLILVTAISLAMSALFHRFVELPAIRAGNRVCTLLAARTRSAVLASASD